MFKYHVFEAVWSAGCSLILFLCKSYSLIFILISILLSFGRLPQVTIGINRPKNRQRNIKYTKTTSLKTMKYFRTDPSSSMHLWIEETQKTYNSFGAPLVLLLLANHKKKVSRQVALIPEISNWIGVGVYAVLHYQRNWQNWYFNTVRPKSIVTNKMVLHHFHYSGIWGGYRY